MELTFDNAELLLPTGPVLGTVVVDVDIEMETEHVLMPGAHFYPKWESYTPNDKAAPMPTDAQLDEWVEQNHEAIVQRCMAEGRRW